MKSKWQWSFSLLVHRKFIPSFLVPVAFARLAGRGKGKSGGFRVVYFFLVEPRRIYMAAIYAKSQRENLSAADQNVLVKLAAQIKKTAKGGRQS
jgi:hypothetical protein